MDRGAVAGGLEVRRSGDGSVGISPGFRLPPPRVVEDAEVFEEEDPAEGEAIIRHVQHAPLYELSVVTRPAYRSAAVEMRSVERQPLTGHLRRYRL